MQVYNVQQVPLYTDSLHSEMSSLVVMFNACLLDIHIHTNNIVTRLSMLSPNFSQVIMSYVMEI